MIARFIVLSYFSLYLMSSWLAEAVGLDALRGLILLATAAYLALRFLHDFEARRDLRQAFAARGLSLIVIYTSLYSALYFSRASTSTAAAAVNSAILVAHVLFWAVVYTDGAYLERRRVFFNDLWVGIAIAFIIGFLFSLSLAGFRLTPGAIHNLAEGSPYIRSDLDVPILAMIVGIVGMVYLMPRRRLGPVLDGLSTATYPSRVVAAGLLASSLLGLFMYGRRTPMIAIVIAGFLVWLPAKWAFRLIATSAVFPLIPLFWTVAVKILIPLTQNPIAEAVLARNDIKSYLTATNRLAVWLRALDFIRDFRPAHLWGYGGAPANILPTTSIGFTHVHNAFMQLFFEGGYICVALAGLILIQAVRRTSVVVRYGILRGDAIALLGVFLGWLVLSGVEPMFRGISAGSLLILLLVPCIANLYHETTPSRLGSKSIIVRLPQSALPLHDDVEQ